MYLDYSSSTGRGTRVDLLQILGVAHLGPKRTVADQEYDTSDTQGNLQQQHGGRKTPGAARIVLRGGRIYKEIRFVSAEGTRACRTQGQLVLRGQIQ